MNIGTPFLILVYIMGAGLIGYVFMLLFKTMFPNGVKAFMNPNKTATPTVKGKTVVDASTEELEKNKQYLEEQLKKVDEEKKRREGAKA